jgi:hypothetical protein
MSQKGIFSFNCREKIVRITSGWIESLMEVEKCRASASKSGLIQIHSSLEIKASFDDYFRDHDLDDKILKLLVDFPQLLIFTDITIKRHGLDSIVFSSKKELEMTGCEEIILRCALRAFNAKIKARGIEILSWKTQSRVSRIFSRFYLSSE